MGCEGSELDRPVGIDGKAWGSREMRPLRNVEQIWSAITEAGSGPPGRYQCVIQFKAPMNARVMVPALMFGAKSPRATPSRTIEVSSRR